MSDKFLLLVSVIANAVIFFSVYSLEEKRDQWKIIPGGTEEIYQNCIAADDYVKIVASKDYQTSICLSCLYDLRNLYKNLSCIYELYLADCYDEPEAIQFFWGETLMDMYKYLSKIPPLSRDYSIELLKKGANKPIPKSEGIDFRYIDYCNCCRNLHDIYSNGELVPRDTVLANYYLGLIENRK